MRYLGIFMVGSLLVLSGCAVTQNPDLEIEGLRKQLNIQEGQAQEKDRQIASLQDSLYKEKSASEGKAELQAQLEGKEKTIASLQAALDKESKQRALLSERIDVLTGQYKTHGSTNYIKQIQTALKNAGYDPGIIDGKLGSKTRKAIRYFQKAGGLDINGKIDKKTWLKLKKYLHVK